MQLLEDDWRLPVVLEALEYVRRHGGHMVRVRSLCAWNGREAQCHMSCRCMGLTFEFGITGGSASFAVSEGTTPLSTGSGTDALVVLRDFDRVVNWHVRDREASR